MTETVMAKQHALTVWAKLAVFVTQARDVMLALSVSRASASRSVTTQVVSAKLTETAPNLSPVRRQLRVFAAPTVADRSTALVTLMGNAKVTRYVMRVLASLLRRLVSSIEALVALALRLGC